MRLEASDPYTGGRRVVSGIGGQRNALDAVEPETAAGGMVDQLTVDLC